jgi:structural maintenance of chromosome 4
VSIIANYIKEQTKNSQFIIISLRNHMFELANKLVGIYKTYDITKCLTFNPDSTKLVVEEEKNNHNP